jgi:hypothetical protein
MSDSYYYRIQTAFDSIVATPPPGEPLPTMLLEVRPRGWTGGPMQGNLGRGTWPVRRTPRARRNGDKSQPFISSLLVPYRAPSLRVDLFANAPRSREDKIINNCATSGLSRNGLCNATPRCNGKTGTTYGFRGTCGTGLAL